MALDFSRQCLSRYLTFTVPTGSAQARWAFRTVQLTVEKFDHTGNLHL